MQVLTNDQVEEDIIVEDLLVAAENQAKTSESVFDTESEIRVVKSFAYVQAMEIFAENQAHSDDLLSESELSEMPEYSIPSGDVAINMFDDKSDHNEVKHQSTHQSRSHSDETRTLPLPLL